MQVLYFSRDYTLHDHRFLSAIGERCQKVYYLRLERRGKQTEERPLPASVELIPWRGGQKPARLRDGPGLLADLRQILSKLKPDLVHAGPIQSATFLTALSGFSPLVSMSWGSDLLVDADRNIAYNRASRFALKHSTILLADCQAVSQKAQRLGFPPERVVLFPWGLDLELFSPGNSWWLRQKLGWENAFVLFSVRAWEPIYGVDLLVGAFARAAKKVPQLRLLLLGGGSQAGQIRRILEENEVVDKVYFGGHVSNEELPEFYRSADLYLSASHSDGSSVSLMEALACGRPVLVSDIPGNREWVKPSQAGWLFEDGNETSLEEGILAAVPAGEQRSQMSEAGRAIAEQRANWNRNVDIMMAGYSQAVALAAKTIS